MHKNEKNSNILGHHEDLLHRVATRKFVSIHDIRGVDQEELHKKNIPEDASVLAIDSDDFKKLPPEEQKAMLEDGYSISECEVWSIEALDDESPTHHGPIKKLDSEIYVVAYHDKRGHTNYTPLTSVLTKEELKKVTADLHKAKKHS